MKLTVLQLEVPLAEVEDSLLEHLTSDRRQAVKLVKQLDDMIAEWDFTLELYDYFAEQKRVHDTYSEET